MSILDEILARLTSNHPVPQIGGQMPGPSLFGNQAPTEQVQLTPEQLEIIQQSAAQMQPNAPAPTGNPRAGIMGALIDSKPVDLTMPDQAAPAPMAAPEPETAPAPAPAPQPGPADMPMAGGAGEQGKMGGLFPAAPDANFGKGPAYQAPQASAPAPQSGQGGGMDWSKILGAVSNALMVADPRTRAGAMQMMAQKQAQDAKKGNVNQTAAYLMKNKGMSYEDAMAVASNPSLLQFALAGKDGGKWEITSVRDEDGNMVSARVNPQTGEIQQIGGAAKDNGAPTVTSTFDETGREQKMQWDPSSGSWKPLGSAKAPSNGMTITTNPDGTTTVQQGGTAGRPLTEAQSKDTAWSTRMAGAENILGSDAGKSLSSVTGDLSKVVGGMLPGDTGRTLMPDEYKKALQAQDQWIGSFGRKESGAAINREEYTQWRSTFMPQPGDSDELIQQKTIARRAALAGIAAGMTPQQVSGAIQANQSQGVPIDVNMFGPPGRGTGAPMQVGGSFQQGGVTIKRIK